jgi:hypothetical protein
VVDVAENTINVTGYSDRKQAAEAVAVIEKSQDVSKLDAVLVWVNSIKELRSAYPNYYADTSAFLEVLNTVLSRQKVEQKGRRVARVSGEGNRDVSWFHKQNIRALRVSRFSRPGSFPSRRNIWLWFLSRVPKSAL